MGRQRLIEYEAKHKPVQQELFPATTRVVAEGLGRLTWVDHVEMGDTQTKARDLPAWKLSWREGEVLQLRPKLPDSPPVMAVVTKTYQCPVEFSLVIMVQVSIWMDRKCVVKETLIPVTAISHHLGKVEHV